MHGEPSSRTSLTYWRRFGARPFDLTRWSTELKIFRRVLTEYVLETLVFKRPFPGYRRSRTGKYHETGGGMVIGSLAGGDDPRAESLAGSPGFMGSSLKMRQVEEHSPSAVAHRSIARR